MLLDFSAAFDIVDQENLLSIFQQEIGVEGTALKWLDYFLQHRMQKVQIGDSYSAESLLKYGIAQGSVLGPDLFNIYIRSLRKYIKSTKFSIFGLADAHHLLKTFLLILQVHALGEFFLRLNAGETKILIVMHPSLINNVSIQGTFIDENCVHSAKYLVVVLDDKLPFERTNSQTCEHVLLCYQKHIKDQKLSRI